MSRIDKRHLCVAYKVNAVATAQVNIANAGEKVSDTMAGVRGLHTPSLVAHCWQ